jgi:hypothetical protein
MTPIHPQYIKDADGNNAFVVLTVGEFEQIIEELEEWEDIQLYNEAKKNDTGEYIPVEEAFRRIEANRAKIN